VFNGLRTYLRRNSASWIVTRLPNGCTSYEGHIKQLYNGLGAAEDENLGLTQTPSPITDAKIGKVFQGAGAQP
jgi:hypothetical protein